MPADSITADVTACRERVATDEDCRLLEVSRLPSTDVIDLATESLAAAADLAGDLDAPVCYLRIDRTDDGDVRHAAVAFFYEGVLHVASRTSPEPDDRDEEPPDAATADADDVGPDATTDEVDAEKAAIARELLSSYDEHLGDGDKYQLTYRLAATSLPQLERMRDEARAAAEADPEAEERLARIVFRDGRFNDAYTVADTEMLLNALDVEYDPERVRLQKVHQQAMSLRTLNE